MSDSQKSEWGPGPWQQEPDIKRWHDIKTWLPCIIRRGPVGALCGYVGVPPGHALHGKGYGDAIKETEQTRAMLERPVGNHGIIPLMCSGLAGEGRIALDVLLDCHGGCTYAGKRLDTIEKDAFWWFGFDCAHAGDIAPWADAALRSIGHEPSRRGGEVYRTMDYVIDECTKLASQLAALAQAES